MPQGFLSRFLFRLLFPSHPNIEAHLSPDKGGGTWTSPGIRPPPFPPFFFSCSKVWLSFFSGLSGVWIASGLTRPFCRFFFRIVYCVFLPSCEQLPFPFLCFLFTGWASLTFHPNPLSSFTSSNLVSFFSSTKSPIRDIPLFMHSLCRPEVV